jgi:CRP-like cAMP-binding protein
MPGAAPPTGTPPPVDPEAAALLAFCRKSGHPKSFAAGDTMFREGTRCEQVFLVEAGEVELTLLSGEKQMRLGSAGAHSLLGLSAMIARVPHEFTATAKGVCKALAVSSAEMRKYLQQHPESCLKTVQSIGADILDLASNVIRPLRLKPRYPKI